MSIKTLLVPIAGRDDDRRLLAMARDAALPFGAHIEAAHARPDPRESLPYMTGAASAEAIAMVIDAAQRAADDRARAARALFDGFCADNGVAVATAPPAEGVSAAWHEAVGHETAVLADRGRLVDLIVVARRNGVGADLVETALFDTGAAVLVAPPLAPRPFDGPAIVGWNGSAQAARAITRAIPFLARAASVAVLTAEDGAEGGSKAEDVVERLAWHGIAASAGALDPDRGSVGEALLAEAERAGASLLVIGGYGHSRMRELVLGGVTHDVLDSAQVPILMAH